MKEENECRDEMAVEESRGARSVFACFRWCRTARLKLRGRSRCRRSLHNQILPESARSLTGMICARYTRRRFVMREGKSEMMWTVPSVVAVGSAVSPKLKLLLHVMNSIRYWKETRPA